MEYRRMNLLAASSDEFHHFLLAVSSDEFQHFLSAASSLNHFLSVAATSLYIHNVSVLLLYHVGRHCGGVGFMGFSRIT